jgi:hypothetical protein
MSKSIYEQMKDAGVETASHESDLYVPYNKVTQAIVADYEFKANATTFSSDDNTGVWYDIPFSYDPWYAARGLL